MAALVVAVALAFADASVVALALPELYDALDTSIVGVSWILTAYAVAVAVVAVALAALRGRIAPRRLVGVGAALFAAASIVAGASGSLAMLLTARCAQGIGAAMLLVGSLPVLGSLVGAGRSRRWWALAGAIGTVSGPALGGLLTQAFDWRAIFFAQAPLAAAAVAAALWRPSVARQADVTVAGSRAARDPTTVVADAGLGLLFAALVAALFLSVLLLIEVWRYGPLHGALLVLALPAGMLAARSAPAAPARWRAGAGGALLVLGLVGLALLPGERAVLAVLALASCGAGFDLLHDVLDTAAVPQQPDAWPDAAVSVGARHAGLVLGLFLIAPVLSSSIGDGVDRATLGATRTMLDSELPLSEKLPITWDLHQAIDAARRGRVPDLRREFDQRGASSDATLARTRDALVDTVTDAMTRAFRPAIALAALLAVSATVAGVVVAARAGSSSPPSTRRRRSLGALVVLGAVAGGTVGVGLAAGAWDSGEYVAADPCAATPDPRPGDGADAAVQRVVLSALDGAACELGTTREALVLSLDAASSHQQGVAWDDATMERAVRGGADRALDDAVARGAISGPTASALRFAVDHLPIEQLIAALPTLG